MAHLDIEEASKAVKKLLESIEPEDAEREGLQDTPMRVAKAFAEWTAGYTKDPADVLSKTFESDGYDQMIYVGPIALHSMCEHHLAPFYGYAHVAYIPSRATKRIVGLSKLAKLVEIYAQRLQVQERVTKQIADALETHLEPYGVGVLIEAKHMCMCSRGVKSREAWTSTTELRGAFRDSPARQEFLFKVDRSERPK